jgi:hypothetical protein
MKTQSRWREGPPTRRPSAPLRACLRQRNAAPRLDAVTAGLKEGGPLTGSLSDAGADLIGFTLSDPSFAGELRIGVIQDGAFGAQSAENRHLLAAAAGQAQHLGPAQVRKPAFRHRPAWRQHHLPLAALRPHVFLVADRLALFRAFGHQRSIVSAFILV